MFTKALVCRECSWRTLVGPSELATRLRLIGLLRRDKDPPEDLVLELARESSARMTCPGCKRIGLTLREADEPLTGGAAGDEDWPDGDWQAAVLCEVCRQAIDPERLEFVPGTKRCTACQGKAESGKLDDDEPEFCPKCGSLVDLRVSRGSGLTRYKRFCTGSPACRL
ncbi:MAG: TraR/DksA C4-type zinc finger protein [Planctomycetota bacterium]